MIRVSVNIKDIENKNKLAIVVVGYNRLDSIKRILRSLENAIYPCEAPLVISIDASGYQELYDYVNVFEWKHGTKYVIIKEKRMGLRNHILSCGDLTKYFRGVIILEDDVFVSPYFYNYSIECINKYDSEDRVSGISLYRPCMDCDLPIDYVVDGNDTFAYQNVESWGECWTERMWKQFREWYNDTPDHNFSNIDMPERMKNWEKAWSKYYMAFQIETGRYFVYPSVSHTTCFSEAGEHGFASTIGQTILLSGEKKYDIKPFEALTKYDIYGTNHDIYEWMNMSEDELCVDFNGTNSNNKHCRYILSPYKYPYKVIREFALALRPIELNIKYGLSGKGLYLYDTENASYKNISKEYTTILAYYQIREFNIRSLYKYVYSYTKELLLRKINSMLRKRK